MQDSQGTARREQLFPLDKGQGLQNIHRVLQNNLLVQPNIHQALQEVPKLHNLLILVHLHILVHLDKLVHLNTPLHLHILVLIEVYQDTRQDLARRVRGHIQDHQVLQD